MNPTDPAMVELRELEEKTTEFLGAGVRLQQEHLDRLIALRTETGLTFNTFNGKFEDFDFDAWNRPL